MLLTCSSWLSIYSFTSGGQSLLKSEVPATSGSADTLQFQNAQQIPSPLRARALSPSHITHGDASPLAVTFVCSGAGWRSSPLPLPCLSLTLSPDLSLCFQCLSFHFVGLSPTPGSFQLPMSQSLSICVSFPIC